MFPETASPRQARKAKNICSINIDAVSLSLRVLYERSIYVLLIFAHLHLHRRRIRRDLLTAHMIEKTA